MNYTAELLTNCLSSKRRVVQAIPRHDIYFGLMKSPIGRNVFRCCSRYGVRSLAISEVTTFLINKFVHNNINEELMWKANLIIELIFLKDRSFSLSGSLFNCVDFDCMIEHLCTGKMPHCIFQMVYFRFMVPLAPLEKRSFFFLIVLQSFSFSSFAWIVPLLYSWLVICLCFGVYE